MVPNKFKCWGRVEINTLRQIYKFIKNKIEQAFA